MKSITALFWAMLPSFVLLGQNQSIDAASSTINYLEEVVLIDSRFPLKRSQSGKTVVKIDQEQIEQFSGLGLGILLSTHLGIDVIGKNLNSGHNPRLKLTFLKGSASSPTMAVISLLKRSA